MHSDDAMELRVTWEEAQELLRPPTNSPTIIKIEDCEFEEYDVSILHSCTYLFRPDDLSSLLKFSIL